MCGCIRSRGHTAVQNSHRTSICISISKLQENARKGKQDQTIAIAVTYNMCRRSKLYIRDQWGATQFSYRFGR